MKNMMRLVEGSRGKDSAMDYHDDDDIDADVDDGEEADKDGDEDVDEDEDEDNDFRRQCVRRTRPGRAVQWVIRGRLPKVGHRCTLGKRRDTDAH